MSAPDFAPAFFTGDLLDQAVVLAASVSAAKGVRFRNGHLAVRPVAATRQSRIRGRPVGAGTGRWRRSAEPWLQRIMKGSFSEFVMAKVVSVSQLRQELDKQPKWAEPFLLGVRTLLDWVNANSGKMYQLLQAQSALSAEFKQEAELKLHEYLALTAQMLDDRDYAAAPGLISIGTKDRSKWNPAGYFKKTFVLTPYCECKGNIHACKDGCVEFTKDRAWWEKMAPWVARGTKLLTAGITLAFAGMPLALGDDVFDVIKEDVHFMGELAKHMELHEGDRKAQPKGEEAAEAELGKSVGEGDRESRLTRAALAGLLEELAPTNYRARQWGRYGA